jgi:hypothetical protein
MILTSGRHFSDVDPSNPCLFVQDDLIFFIGQRVFVDLWVQAEEPALSALDRPGTKIRHCVTFRHHISARLALNSSSSSGFQQRGPKLPLSGVSATTVSWL